MMISTLAAAERRLTRSLNLLAIYHLDHHGGRLSSTCLPAEAVTFQVSSSKYLKIPEIILSFTLWMVSKSNEDPKIYIKVIFGWKTQQKVQAG